MTRLEFQAGVGAGGADARYVLSDFALDYGHQRVVESHDSSVAARINSAVGIGPARDFLMIAGTLTLVYTGEGRDLVAFDAYTNSQLWKRVSSLALPRVNGVGQVRLVDPLPDDIAALAAPTYVFAETQRRLQIAWHDVAVARESYRVSDKLIVGVADGGLASLLVEGLVLA